RRDSNHARHGNEERLGKSVEDDDREGFFRKIFKDKNEERKDEGHQKPDEREKVGANIEDDKRDGFFRQLFKEKNDEKKEGSTPSKKEEDDKGHKNADDDNFFRRLFNDKNEEKKGIVHDRNEDDKCEEGDKENFFRKLFKDKLEERRTEGPDKNDDYGKGSSGIEEEDNPEFLSFRRLFRVHPEDPKSGHIESSQSNNLSEGSLGSESFFKRLFRDRDRSLEDSEIFGSKMAKEKHPGTTGINEKQSGKPPLPINAVAELRKGSYYASLELVQALCDTSYGLVDIFPIEDRKIALRESLIEINSQIASAEKNGDDFCLCFPMGKGIYRVVHIPEDESVLLNSREKAPYLICVEVLKAEAPSHSKGSSDGHKLSKDGIPLANGDVQLPKPPPWAYPLWSRHETQNYETDIMLKSTSQVIDQAMAQLWETKVKFVNVSFSIEKLGRAKSIVLSETGRRLRHDATDSNMIFQAFDGSRPPLVCMVLIEKRWAIYKESVFQQHLLVGYRAGLDRYLSPLLVAVARPGHSVLTKKLVRLELEHGVWRCEPVMDNRASSTFAQSSTDMWICWLFTIFRSSTFRLTRILPDVLKTDSEATVDTGIDQKNVQGTQPCSLHSPSLVHQDTLGLLSLVTTISLNLAKRE
ncbi:hypothetical protein ACJX0J_036636, partial [Zea mays]